MNSTRVAIVDDEPLARMRLRRLLSALPNLEIVAECSSGDNLRSELENRQVDVIFLDIHMHNIDGFSAFEDLSEPRPEVVFVTAHSEHAVKAFDIDAADYLVKPISLNRLRVALDRARKKRVGKSTYIRPNPPAFPRRLALPIDGKIRLLELDQLDCAFANANYLEIKLDNQTFIIRKTLTWLEQELDPSNFIRVHRSCLVRIKAVIEAEPLVSGRYKLLLNNGATVYSGRNFKDSVRNALALKKNADIQSEGIEGD